MASVRRETGFLIIGDLILLVASLWIALTLRTFTPPSAAYFYEHLIVFVYVFLISLLVFFVAGLYERHARLVKRVIGTRILGAQIANTVVASVLFFVLPGPLEPKTILGLYLIVSVILVSCWRFFLAPHISAGTQEKAILVATGEEAKELAGELSHNRKYYVEIAEYIDTKTMESSDIVSRVEKGLKEGASLLILDRSARATEGLLALYGLFSRQTSLVEFSSFYEDIFDRVPLGHVDDAWLLANLPKRQMAYDAGKALFDRVLGALGLVVALIFILPAALTVSLSGGTPFISHERIGRGGKRFKIYKMRTMLFDDHGDPDAQRENRVTAVGAFLRKTRIDELPQLWNVLKGDLSFVGPRPELPKIAEVYEREIPYYGARHLVTPGLSGWAQIWHQDPPRGPADVERTRRKLSFDLYYLKHRSPGIDMAIALKTLRALLSFSGT
ncbi:MAG: sugar transferase [Candidatus Pacebacteria bacterium]|nr:sugar transferase [Candidatus Paceibacterota bacterium]